MKPESHSEAPSHSDADAPRKLSVVIPVYQSEASLAPLVQAISEALLPTGWNYEVILVNDFSPDRSWEVIVDLALKDPRVVGVDLRRNFGQDNAILTGMRLARGAFIVVMDDDLQHHPKYIPALLKEAERGFDVVYGEFRKRRQKRWKNAGSWINGRIAEALIYKPRNIYLSPFKIIRKDVADMVCNYGGPWPYIDGLLYQATWRVSSIPVDHFARFSGKSNYTFLRALGVSARLVFSSLKPVRLVTWSGLALVTLGLFAAIAIAAYRILIPQNFAGESIGWAALLVTVLVIAGMQMLIFGILGEYLGRIYLRVDQKPQTSIREVIRDQCNPAWQQATAAADRESEYVV